MNRIVREKSKKSSKKKKKNKKKNGNNLKKKRQQQHVPRYKMDAHINKDDQDDFSLLDFPLKDIKNTIKSIKNNNEKKITYDLKTTMLMVKTANTTTTDDEKKGIAASVTTAIVVPGKKQTNIQDLPNELLLIICSFSNAKLLVKTEYVSKFWKHFLFHNLNEKILWNRLYKKHFISQPKGFFISKATTLTNSNNNSMKKLYFQRKRSERAWLTCSARSNKNNNKKDGDNNNIVAEDLIADRETIIVGENQEFKTIHNAIAAASAFDLILIKPGTYSSEKAIFISKSIEIIGVGKHPKNIIFDRSALIIRDNAKVRFNNITFLSPCITTPINCNVPGWLQFDDCLLHHPQFVELSGGNNNSMLNNNNAYENNQNSIGKPSFSGSISRSLLNCPNFPNNQYFIAKCLNDKSTSSFNVVSGEVKIGSYDVEFVEEEE